jgi:hypothetical protein
MPDRLRERRGWVEFALVVALLAAAGVVGALLWEWFWTAPVGVVVDHRWIAEDESGLQGMFDSTGWYVVVASLAGLLVGFVAALFLDRVPLLTLAALIVGSALGTFLMLRLGAALGPPDPRVLALGAPDGTHLPGELTVSGRSPWIALPAGALVALTVVFIGLAPRHHRASVDDVSAG